MSGAQINLTGVRVLIAESDAFGSDLLNRMLRGFGVSDLTFVKTAKDACKCLEDSAYDLLICAAKLQDASGEEFVKSVRRMNPPNRFMPILILTTHSQMRTVRAIRDAGAHMIVKKPVSPAVLFDRIAWAARASRPFVEAGVYVGPDRRFKFVDPPAGVARRDGDPSAAAAEPNAPQAKQAR